MLMKKLDIRFLKKFWILFKVQCLKIEKKREGLNDNFMIILFEKIRFVKKRSYLG